MPDREKQVYRRVIEKLFFSRYKNRSKRVQFSSAQLFAVAEELGLAPKNRPDVLYTYRYRRDLPKSIKERAPAGMVWLIRGSGVGKYRFDAVPEEYARIKPKYGLSETLIPDATPGVIAKYALTDEQALLAKVRYNRLVDIFMGIACYSLQSHLRTQVKEVGQVETDEVYVGIDKQGTHYVLPIQAKGGKDRHSIVQIEQDFAMCSSKKELKAAVCRPIAAQFMEAGQIALIAFTVGADGTAKILTEKHYRLVPQEDITPDELNKYRSESARLER